MTPEQAYIHQVVEKLPAGELRRQIAMELQSHIADRLERGSSVDDALRQLGDPAALAESYLAAVPLVSAPLGRRVAAKLVDLLPLVLVPAVLFLPSLIVMSASQPGSGGAGEPLEHPLFFLTIPIALAGILAYIVYLVVAEHRTGQTIGKRLFGLQVVTESGGRIGLGQAVVRYLPLFIQIFMIDALFALFTDRRQRAFELLSKTRVVVAPTRP